VPDDTRTLSPRAQEILRRADEHVASVRRGHVAAAAPAAPVRIAPAPLDGPPDLQRVMDRIQAGLRASREQLEALSAALGVLQQELGVPDPAPGAEPEMPAALTAHTHLPGEIGDVADAHVADRASGASQDAARLVAIEMAVAGETREMVGRRLREEFGISDPKEILDDVFGPGTGSSSRMR
jgi:hypothetical protein